MRYLFLITVFNLLNFSAYASLLNSNELSVISDKILVKTNAEKIVNLTISTDYITTIGSTLSFPIRIFAEDDFPSTIHFYNIKFTAKKKETEIKTECLAYDYHDDYIIISNCKFSKEYRQYSIIELFKTINPYYQFSYQELND